MFEQQWVLTFATLSLMVNGFEVLIRLSKGLKLNTLQISLNALVAGYLFFIGFFLY